MPSEALPPLALVTGASGGIGRAVAIRLLRDGWHVAGWCRRRAEIDHPNFQPVIVDLTQPQQADAALRGDASFAALVHAAGWMKTAAIADMDLDASETMWRVHVQAAMQLGKALLPRMAAERAGRVVLIGSRVAHGMAGRSQYAAVKAALIGLSRSWAAELVSKGVTVNLVSPAATRTRMLEDPARMGSPPKVPPLGRYIEPDEVAALVAFLLSPEAAAITGQDIAICGGASVAP